MTIQFIYTFSGSEQQRTDFPFVLPIIKDKNTLIDFATAMLSMEDKQDLIKISCCIYLDGREGIKEPRWYSACNGKVWVDDLEQWRKHCSIVSTVNKEYINQFMHNN